DPDDPPHAPASDPRSSAASFPPAAARVDTAPPENGSAGVSPPWSTPTSQVTAAPTDGGQAAWTFSPEQLPGEQSGYALFDTETSAYAGAPAHRDVPVADTARVGQGTLSRPKRTG